MFLYSIKESKFIRSEESDTKCEWTAASTVLLYERNECDTIHVIL